MPSPQWWTAIQKNFAVASPRTDASNSVMSAQPNIPHHQKVSRNLPISAARVKLLALQCGTIVEADAIVKLPTTLASLMDAHAELAQAWHRGEFLRNVGRIAAIAKSVSDAARMLGMGKGQDLRNMLDTDREVGQIWRQRRLDFLIETMEAFRAKVKEGEISGAMLLHFERLFATILQEENPAPSGSDLERIPAKLAQRLADVSRTTLHEWTRRIEDPLPQNHDGTFNLFILVPWLIRWTEGKVLKAGKPTSVNPLAFEKSIEIRRQRQLDEGFMQDTREVVRGLLAREQAGLDAERHVIDELARDLEGLNLDQRTERIASAFNRIRELRRRLPETIRLPDEAAPLFEQLMNALQPQEETPAEPGQQEINEK